MLRLVLGFTAIIGICLGMAWYVSQDQAEEKESNKDSAEKADKNPDAANGKPENSPAATQRTPSGNSTAQGKAKTRTAKTKSPSLSLPEIPGSIEDVFATGQKLTKQIDDVVQQQLSLTEEEEIKLGRDLHKHLAREIPFWKAPQITARLNRLSEPLLEQRSRQEIRYSIYLLDDEAVNAFSHLGGHIYITKGLLNLQPSDAELEAVLGHEIAHVDLKHCVQKLTYAARASQIGGDEAGKLVQLGYQLIALGYSEEQEFDADAWSYKTMLKLGRTKQQATEFLRRIALLEAHGENPRGEKKSTVLDRGITQVENHFRSHPPTAIRIRQLEQLP